MFARVKARGVTDAELARVEAPLGLNIGGETPAEIAVSIVGGIIAHHKGVRTQASTSNGARAGANGTGGAAEADSQNDSDRPPSSEVRDGEIQQA